MAIDNSFLAHPSLNISPTNQQILRRISKWDISQITSLYHSNYACQCVVRILPPLAQIYLMRFLYVTSIPMLKVNQWYSQSRDVSCISNKLLHDRTIKLLTELKMLYREAGGHKGEADGNQDGSKDSASTEQVYLRIHKKLSTNLRHVMMGSVNFPFETEINYSESHMVTSGDCEQSVSGQMDSSFLFDYTQQRWESVLQFLVGSDEQTWNAKEKTPSVQVVTCLLRSNLLEQVDEGLRITNTGFQFLLKDVPSQVWTLVWDVIDNETKEIEAKGELLSFIFELSFCVQGQGYRLDKITGPDSEFIDFLQNLGVLYIPSTKGNKYFYPTYLGIQLASGNSSVSTMTTSQAQGLSTLSQSSIEMCQIIIETNFRVYAYTQSSFQISLLSLFITMKYRLPNVIVGHLTRDSVRGALLNGISSDQIINFLNAHAHPQMKSRGGVPSNVCDEIHLWEAEKDRVQMVSAVVFDDFDTEFNWKKVKTFAEEMGHLKWANAAKKTIAVDEKGVEDIKEFIRRNNFK